MLHNDKKRNLPVNTTALQEYYPEERKLLIKEILPTKGEF
jgi:hypothetical protein